MKHTYQPRHLKQPPRPRRPWSRQALLPIAAAGLILLGATPAHAGDITIPKGSTLWSLAARYCGSGAKYLDLARANGIANPDRIYAGHRLTINCARTNGAASRSTVRTAPVAGGWVNPLPGVRLTSCWGAGRNHKGLDMDGYLGQPVRAAAAGTVSNVGWFGSGYGLEVMVNHGGGVWTHYAHLSRTNVVRGQRVAAGQIIAAVGNSGDVIRGRSDGSHLHFEVARSAGIYGTQINPAPWLRSHGVALGGC